MENEKLLQPRYKVKADYPCAMHDVGDIIETYESAISYAVKIGESTEKVCLDDFPAIFEKLEWWEHRLVDEMPTYLIQANMISSKGLPLPDICVKVKKHFTADNGDYRDDSYRVFCTEDGRQGWPKVIRAENYSDFMPATEEDYLRCKELNNIK